MAEVVVREVTAADLPPVLEMVHALAAHHGDQATLDLAGLAGACLGAAPWVRVLVAQQAGQVSGYAALCPLARLQFGERGMDIQNLYVAADRRGQGVGRALITAAERHARALGCVYLAVGTHPDNSAAQQVYLRAGFEQRPAPGPRFGKWLVAQA